MRNSPQKVEKHVINIHILRLIIILVFDEGNTRRKTKTKANRNKVHMNTKYISKSNLNY